MQKIFLTPLLLTLLIAILPTAVQAAAGAPPATHIDGGLSLLMAAGGAYGVKKWRDYTKKSEERN